jgi:hypothetical protein
MLIMHEYLIRLRKIYVVLNNPKKTELLQVNKYYLRNQVIIITVISIAFGFAVTFWSGGYDAVNFYFRKPFSNTTAPAWVYLVTYPISLIRWPYSWQLLTFLSIFLSGITSIVWDNTRWWVAIFSSCMVWNIWLGQIEIFSIIGILVSGLVLRKLLHPYWLGISWIALLTKPQVGFGVVLLEIFWIFSDDNLNCKHFIGSVFVSFVTFLISLYFYPSWIFDWLMTIGQFNATWWNASIWPFGLIVWPFVIYYSRGVDRNRQIRMFAAASLLSSPYFALYHCVMLLVLSKEKTALLLTWLLIIIGNIFMFPWMKWGWILPSYLLVLDFVQLHRYDNKI